MTRISIIAACRNGARTLQVMLDSIRQQTFNDFELIIIDGASSDGTQGILQANEDVVDFWLSEPDNSIAEAWNKGIAHANGMWVLFLGVDDRLYSPDTLAQMAPHLETGDVDLVYGKTLFDGGLFDGQTMGAPFDVHKLWRSMTIPHIATFHARRLFDEVGLYDPDFKIALDYELLLRKHHLTARFVPQIVTLMNGADTTSTSNPVHSFLDAARAQRKNRSISPPAIWLRFAREVLYNYLVRLKRRLGR